MTEVNAAPKYSQRRDLQSDAHLPRLWSRPTNLAASCANWAAAARQAADIVDLLLFMAYAMMGGIIVGTVVTLLCQYSAWPGSAYRVKTMRRRRQKSRHTRVEDVLHRFPSLY
ncbi:hypothetical protein ASD32_25775 [Rhizobium sp. Root483D2]|nr:hypothetical protein ASD32_25775 [Rhizobium sp. Root483D2]